MRVQADPLDDVLALVGTTSSLSAGLVAAGEWAVAFEPPPAVKFNAVRRGSCLLRAEGQDFRLEPGDCFLLTRPVAFTLASGPDVPPEPAGPIFAAAGDDGIARATRRDNDSMRTAGARSGYDAGGLGGARFGHDVGGLGGAQLGHDADDVFLIGGRFGFGERAQELLLDALPPVVHVPGASTAAAAVRWALEQIDAELRDRPPASSLLTEHLALVMLIHLLRLHLAAAPPAGGWLAGLADPVVGPALRAMHGKPAYAWTVADLAAVAAVSRSTLAARFKQVVGQGPLDYLTQWRIELAAARLRHGDHTVAAIAHEVGYGSESALSTAFKRVTGQSPRAYRLSRA
ncbi:AraC family transcriptional regulator [Actinoplanes sp. Pm04-4]|uniref:AraC family transcriptional regulator n=1 Tax=Paractinoplanes pyxinae TaxID=2997416 RepID=A0ABT4B0T5_9ACTN|nr:AraC family transcriptional regulator [Actinoplanes pyxinae]MCY1139677.1 AraC family transcriptional regulator [Actinoplanes pyxinae]